MAELHIRTMQSFDIGAVMAVERSAYQEPWTEAIMTSCQQAQFRCEVALCDGELVAHMISQLIVDELHLLNLCVANHRQRQGIGLTMVQHLLRAGRQLEAQRVFLEVRSSNLAALTLYRGLGFEQVGERADYYRSANGREDALVMAADL